MTSRVGRRPENLKNPVLPSDRGWRRQLWHAPPQQPPPVMGGGADGAGPGAARPPMATRLSNFTVSSWPSGQVAGSDDCAIGRSTSKVDPQVLHRKS